MKHYTIKSCFGYTNAPEYLYVRRTFSWQCHFKHSFSMEVSRSIFFGLRASKTVSTLCPHPFHISGRPVSTARTQLSIDTWEAIIPLLSRHPSRCMGHREFSRIMTCSESLSTPYLHPQHANRRISCMARVEHSRCMTAQKLRFVCILFNAVWGRFF